MRRPSVSGIKNPTRDASDTTTPRHQFVGQDGAEKSSAFVFGHRKDTTWKFYAQIVKGLMAGEGMNALKSSTEKVVRSTKPTRFGIESSTNRTRKSRMNLLIDEHG
jgi:hypothetical protein